MARPGPAALPATKKLMSNTAMAGVLTFFVGASYYFSMHAVGTTDLEKEVIHFLAALHNIFATAHHLLPLNPTACRSLRGYLY